MNCIFLRNYLKLIHHIGGNIFITLTNIGSGLFVQQHRHYSCICLLSAAHDVHWRLLLSPHS